MRERISEIAVGLAAEAFSSAAVNSAPYVDGQIPKFPTSVSASGWNFENPADGWREQQSMRGVKQWMHQFSVFLFQFRSRFFYRDCEIENPAVLRRGLSLSKQLNEHQSIVRIRSVNVSYEQ